MIGGGARGGGRAEMGGGGPGSGGLAEGGGAKVGTRTGGGGRFAARIQIGLRSTLYEASMNLI